MEKMIIDKYIEEAQSLYEQKELKKRLFAQKVLFTRKDNSRAFSLEDVNTYKEKTKSALVQNEIRSIAKVMEKKIVIFQTRTINPMLNVPLLDTTLEKIDADIKKQYEHFKRFHRHMKQFKYEDRKLNYKFVRMYELTKSLNIHSHCLDILDDALDLEHYLKSIVHARKNHDIGRIELAVNVPTFRHIEKLFKKGFVVRVNNQYITLKLHRRFGFYVISDFVTRQKGNFIYIRVLQENQNDSKAITKYAFKYLLKTTKKTSKEQAIFSKLKIRQQQFSKDFFSCGIRKDILYRTSSKIYTMVKRKREGIFLKPTLEDLKGCIFYTSHLFKKKVVFQLENYVFYRKSKRANEKWIELLDTQKYAIEVYEDRFSDASLYADKEDVNGYSSLRDWVKKANDVIRALFYSDIEYRTDKKEFQKWFESEKPYLSSLITIEEIQYENQKAREEYLNYIDKMEQKIADYYERGCPYTIELCSDF